MLWAANVCSWDAFAQPGPVSSISLGRFFSVRVRWGLVGSSRLTCSARTSFRAVTTPLLSEARHHITKTIVCNSHHTPHSLI